MGKQSSRIYYKRNDHKDIYCLDENGIGHYHNSMWLSDDFSELELVWQKLHDGELHSGIFGNYPGTPFVHYPDESGETIGEFYIGSASNRFSADYYPLINGDGSMVNGIHHTLDGVTWLRNIYGDDASNGSAFWNGEGIFSLVNNEVYFNDELLDVALEPPEPPIGYTHAYNFEGAVVAREYLVLIDYWRTYDSLSHVQSETHRYRFITSSGYIAKEETATRQGQMIRYAAIEAHTKCYTVGKYLYSMSFEVIGSTATSIMLRFDLDDLSIRQMNSTFPQDTRADYTCGYYFDNTNGVAFLQTSSWADTRTVKSVDNFETTAQEIIKENPIDLPIINSPDGNDILRIKTNSSQPDGGYFYVTNLSFPCVGQNLISKRLTHFCEDQNGNYGFGSNGHVALLFLVRDRWLYVFFDNDNFEATQGSFAISLTHPIENYAPL